MGCGQVPSLGDGFWCSRIGSPRWGSFQTPALAPGAGWEPGRELGAAGAQWNKRLRASWAQGSDVDVFLGSCVRKTEAGVLRGALGPMAGCRGRGQVPRRLVPWERRGAHAAGPPLSSPRGVFATGDGVALGSAGSLMMRRVPLLSCNLYPRGASLGAEGGAATRAHVGEVRAQAVGRWERTRRDTGGRAGRTCRPQGPGPRVVTAYLQGAPPPSSSVLAAGGAPPWEQRGRGGVGAGADRRC